MGASEYSVPRGIGGWLAWLIIVLVFIGPAKTLVSTQGDAAKAERAYPALATSAQWQAYRSTALGTVLLFGAVSVVAGVRLYRRREQSVVRQAAVTLWACGPLQAVILAVVEPAIQFGAQSLASAEA